MTDSTANPADGRSGFGCARCFGNDAAEAYACPLVLEHGLIDDTHFGMSIVRCQACGQRFASIFTEFVDWVDGDDPQYVDVLPVTDAEAENLVRQGENVDQRAIEALGEQRRRLVMNYPKGGPRSVFWSTGGLTVRPGF